ncbi:MAG: hypothetical protein JWQ21_4086 [Herminiimonas sp.]|nr:hypothetical protein [Herminiimonas sp.]
MLFQSNPPINSSILISACSCSTRLWSTHCSLCRRYKRPYDQVTIWYGRFIDMFCCLFAHGAMMGNIYPSKSKIFQRLITDIQNRNWINDFCFLILRPSLLCLLFDIDSSLLFERAFFISGAYIQLHSLPGPSPIFSILGLCKSLSCSDQAFHSVRFCGDGRNFSE